MPLRQVTDSVSRSIVSFTCSAVVYIVIEQDLISKQDEVEKGTRQRLPSEAVADLLVTCKLFCRPRMHLVASTAGDRATCQA